MNKRRSTYRELSPGASRAARSMRSGRWLRPSRTMWLGLRARFPISSPAVSSPAGAALSEQGHPFRAPSPHSSPASITRAGAALAEPATEPAPSEHARSMGAVVVIAVGVTVIALSVIFGTEVVLRALGRTSVISEFVGSPATNPGYIYNLILIAIAVLGASLGTAFLVVSAIVGVRLERRQGLGTDAAAAADRGALGDAPATSRFAPPASAEPAPLFTQPGAQFTQPGAQFTQPGALEKSMN